MIVRLGMTAIDHWEALDGYAVGHAMPDIRTLPLERFCNYVWWMATKNAKEVDQARLKAKLWLPPPTPQGRAPEEIDPRSPWSAENEMKAFASLKASLTGTATTAPAAPVVENRGGL